MEVFYHFPSGGSSARGDRSGSSTFVLDGIGVEGCRDPMGFFLALPWLGVALLVSLFLEEDLDGERAVPFMLRLR